MTSRSGRVSKPAPVLADPSNVAKPSTSSHRAAALAVITERQAAASAAANDHSPHITPPPETLITTPAVDKRPGRPSASVGAKDDNESDHQDHPDDQTLRKSTKRARVDDGPGNLKQVDDGKCGTIISFSIISSN